MSTTEDWTPPKDIIVKDDSSMKTICTFGTKDCENLKAKDIWPIHVWEAHQDQKGLWQKKQEYPEWSPCSECYKAIFGNYCNRHFEGEPM